MTKRSLPAAHIGARSEKIRSEVSPNALHRWVEGLSVRAESDQEASTDHINMLGIIGEDWLGEGVTAAGVTAALHRAGGRDVVVNLNSPGGDFFEGLAIYNMLREYSGAVTVRILGLAASAASVIAMAGDQVQIARAGFLMIHNTWCLAAGDRNDLLSVVDQLSAFDEVTAELFAARTGMDAMTIAAMLDRESWLSGKAAIEQGFADSFLSSDLINTGFMARGEPVKAKALVDTYMARGGAPRSVRRPLLAQLTETGTPRAADDGTPRAATSQAFADLMATVQSYRSAGEQNAAG